MYQSKQKPIPAATAPQAPATVPPITPSQEPKPQAIPQDRDPHPFRPVGNFPLKIRKIENKPAKSAPHVGKIYDFAAGSTPVVEEKKTQTAADPSNDPSVATAPVPTSALPEQVKSISVAAVPEDVAAEPKSIAPDTPSQDFSQKKPDFFHFPVFSASSASSVSANVSVPTQGDPLNNPQTDGMNGTDGTNQTNSPAPSGTTAQHTGYFAQPIDQLPTATRQRLLEAYDNFVSENSATGQVKVQTFLAQQAYPLGDVNLIISKRFNDIEYVFYELQTNATGISDNITLPAPPRANSQQPYQQDPFTTYLITAYKQGFISEEPYEIEIFENIKAIQPIEMLPLIRKVEEETEEGQEE